MKSTLQESPVWYEEGVSCDIKVFCELIQICEPLMFELSTSGLWQGALDFILNAEAYLMYS